MSRSQRKSQSQSQADNEDISCDIVNEAVKAILVLDHSKRPIKQSDILNNLNCKPKRSQMKTFYDQVKMHLDELGFDLVPCAGSNNKAFFLLAKLPDFNVLSEFLPQAEQADRTLLVLVLAFIFMKDGSVTEDELFLHLEHLKILTNVSCHDYFGDVKKKILGPFVDQMYISRTSTDDGTSSYFQWGERAKLEVSQLAILEFVCQIGYSGRMKPENWISHYQRIEAENEVDDAEQSI